jgi:caa(3)-type oxidase subunit IV
MHSDAADVQKSLRKYWMIGGMLLVFTAITVAASSLNLGVAAGVTVALIIATMKGSMVASVFMHLSHEKRWIYGALILTVLSFIVLMTVPIFTVMDGIGTPIHHTSAAAAEHAGH